MERAVSRLFYCSIICCFCFMSMGFAASSAKAGALAAQQEKVLHVLLTTPEAGFDPAATSDIASLSITENMFDAMLRYDYLARPVRLVPNTLSAMPEVSADGLTYTFHLQHGIFFTPDPAFQGKPRELVAQDYADSIQRLYEPSLKSPWLFLFEGKLRGDRRWLQTDKQAGTPMPPIDGVQVLDRYTLRLRLNAPDRNFLLSLATPATAALAREVVQAYGGQISNHPVGTGPFRLGRWQRNFSIELLANPLYQRRAALLALNEVKAAKAPKAPNDRALVKAPLSASELASIHTRLQGKKLPLLDRIEVKIVEEQQARVLGLLKAEFDLLEQVPIPLSDMVLQAGQASALPQLKSDLASQGLRLIPFTPLQTYYMWMNMEDPVLGGYTPEKVALRRAIALSYDQDEDIQILEHGLAVAAQSPLPPNLPGYDASYRSPVHFDPALANALLDHYGYWRDAQGLRHLPVTGKNDQQKNTPVLSLLMHSEASTNGQLRDEVWRKSLARIGIQIRIQPGKKSDILRAARLGQVQMTEANWIADFPDGENFYQLLYGANIGRANYARFNLPIFNQRFEAARQLAESPERQRLYREMAQILHAYNPWVLRIHPLSLDVLQPWLQNYVHHPVELTNWRYLDIDLSAQRGHAH